jgi:AraC-like DNA-binding protein
MHDGMKTKKKNIIQEITPVNNYDCFIIRNFPQGKFDFPTHFHHEYELNMIENFQGNRLVGDSNEIVNGSELVLIGPDTYHSWEAAPDFKTHVITVQFSTDLFGNNLLEKDFFRPIKYLLKRAPRGISFSNATKQRVIPKMKELAQVGGFESLIQFLSILNDLATAGDETILCGENFNSDFDEYKSRRIKRVCEYVKRFYMEDIPVSKMAEIANMTETGFCHFFKKRVQKSFVDYLTDVRTGKAAELLIETTDTVSEISIECGFNNLSNFNRAFKKSKNLTPTEFRKLNKKDDTGQF